MKIFHFNNGTGGGVLSVIRNLIHFQQSNMIEQHVIYTLDRSMSKFNFIPDNDQINAQYFYYSRNSNLHNICKRLASLIPDDNNVILVAHDWLELAMISRIGLKRPVVFVVHGDYDYYYDLARDNANYIDSFICVAESIASNLKLLMPERLNDIHYLRFPVKNPIVKSSFNEIRNLLFLGRCEYNKGFNLLPLINSHLKIMGLNLTWTIIGEVIDDSKFTESDSVVFLGNIDNEKVLLMLHEFDLIIFPSLKEGMPVSLIEAMKAGVVPIVNDIQGGIQELVHDRQTGFKIENNNPMAYATMINSLFNDIALYHKIAEKVIEQSMALFSPTLNAFQYESIYFTVNDNNREKLKRRIYGSRLDRSGIPDFIVVLLRNIRFKIIMVLSDGFSAFLEKKINKKIK